MSFPFECLLPWEVSTNTVNLLQQALCLSLWNVHWNNDLPLACSTLYVSFPFECLLPCEVSTNTVNLLHKHCVCHFRMSISIMTFLWPVPPLCVLLFWMSSALWSVHFTQQQALCLSLRKSDRKGIGGEYWVMFTLLPWKSTINVHIYTFYTYVVHI